MVTVSSCCECTEDPDQPPFVRRNFSLMPIDNYGVQPVLSESDSLYAEAFGLALVLEGSKGPVVSLRDNYPLVPYHFNCCREGKRAEWGLENIRITTVHDFDETHKAGADITDYFRIVGYSGGNIAYLEMDRLWPGIFHNSFDANGNYILPVVLMYPPSSTKVVQFKVVMEFQDQHQPFEKISRPVVLR